MHKYNNRADQCFPIIRKQRARPGRARPGSLHHHHHSPTWEGGQGQSETPSFLLTVDNFTIIKHAVKTWARSDHRIRKEVCKHTTKTLRLHTVACDIMLRKLTSLSPRLCTWVVHDFFVMMHFQQSYPRFAKSCGELVMCIS